MILSNLHQYKNTGLLIMRVGIGIMFVMHGYPKLASGSAGWEDIGKSMSVIGINFMPVFWGLAAACAEFFGGLLLVLGLAFRPACIFMAFTMLIAALVHYQEEHKIMAGSHAIELGIVFLGLLFLGPGSYSFDKK